MPAVLSDKNVCATKVPLNWGEILDKLKKFIDLENSLRSKDIKSATAADDGQLLRLHDDLVNGSELLLEPHALDDQTAADDAAIFAKSVLLLMRMNESVAADRHLLDTARSRTLAGYRPDFFGSHENCVKLREALLRLPGISRTEIKEIEQQVEADVEDARRKQHVVRAICDEFQLRPTAVDLRNNVHRCFSALYPDSGILADEIEVIVTGCMIFFCLPFEGTTLLTDRLQDADPDDQDRVDAFLRRVARFSHWQFAHFPVFGFLRGDSLKQSLLDRLSQRAGLSTDVVAHELGRLIAIVPLHEVDKYVVHDVWGHGWQASMLHYDQLYEQLAHFADPLTLQEQTRGWAGQRMQLNDCFVGDNAQMELDFAKFDRFVELEVAERLPVAMTPVVAEVIADIAEFKFVELNPDQAGDLMSSSLMKMYPSKLDLTLRDVPFYFQQATKTFRLFSQQQRRQQIILDGLIKRDATPEAAARAVRDAVARWKALAHDKYSPKLRWQVADDCINVNVVTRLLLNFLGIHRAKLHTYERIGRLPTGKLPLKSFRDLLLICAAVFFETDPPRNTWRVDEFVSLRVEPLCEQLARTMQ